MRNAGDSPGSADRRCRDGTDGDFESVFSNGKAIFQSDAVLVDGKNGQPG
jgi:hypothetical protein